MIIWSPGTTKHWTENLWRNWVPAKCLTRTIHLPAETILKDLHKIQADTRLQCTNCHVMTEGNNCGFKQINPLGPGHFPVSLLTYRHRSFSHPCHQLGFEMVSALAGKLHWLWCDIARRSKTSQHGRSVSWGVKADYPMGGSW